MKRILYTTTPHGEPFDPEGMEDCDLWSYETALEKAQAGGHDLHAIVVEIVSHHPMTTDETAREQLKAAPFEVINPGGHVVVEADLPPHVGLFTNSTGYCASPAVIAEALRRGIELQTVDCSWQGVQGLSVCRVDDCTDVPTWFHDCDAAHWLTSQGFMLVHLPDCLDDAEAAEDDIKRLDDGEFPSRFYAVKTYTPPETEA